MKSKSPYELRKVKINRNFVLRHVRKDNPQEWQVVKQGVDDPDSSFLRDYPEVRKAHQEYLKKRKKGEIFEQKPW